MIEEVPPPARNGPLPYAPLPRWHRRRWFRRAAALSLVLAVAWAGWRYGPGAWAKARLLYWQRQCLRYSAPEGQVVYDDGSEAATLLARPGYTNLAAAGGPPEAGLTPECWARGCRLAGTAFGAAPSPSGAMLFLHERRSPGGQRRLVAFQAQPGLPLVLGVVPLLIEPGSLTRPPCTRSPVVDMDLSLRLAESPGGLRWRCFAGQPDPADPSHFTLKFTAGGGAGSLEGWLRDDDRLKLSVRCDAPAGSDALSVNGTLHIDLTTGFQSQLTTGSQSSPGKVNANLTFSGSLDSTSRAAGAVSTSGRSTWTIDTLDLPAPTTGPVPQGLFGGLKPEPAGPTTKAATLPAP